MRFAEYTLETAPPAARRTMRAIHDHQGFLPAAVARWAEAPELLTSFTQANAQFEACSLDLVAREVVVFAIAVRNGCHLCVALHTGRLTDAGTAPEVVSALRAGTPLPDPALEAVRTFTQAVLATSGAVPDEALAAFLAHGYTRRNALEVVLGIGVLTMSTLANRLVEAPVDGPLAQYAWTGPAGR